MEYRSKSKSRVRKILSWKRMLLLLCLVVFVVLIVNMPTESSLSQADLKRLNSVSNPTVWDEATVEYYKAVLELDKVSSGDDDDANVACDDFWDEDLNYLIVTGVPPSQNNLAGHLWLYMNLLALSRADRKPHLSHRFLLPKSSYRVLGGLFEDVQFGDLSEVLQCNRNVNVHQLIKHSRFASSLEPIEFNDKSQEVVQLVILTEESKRLKELSRTDFMESWSRPKIQAKYLARVRQTLIAALDRGDKIEDVPKDPSMKEIDVLPFHFVGVYLGAGNRITDIERFKTAMDYHRRRLSGVFFVVVCHDIFSEVCRESFTDSDVHITGSRSEAEDHFALLSTCHANIVSDELSFFAALMNDGETALINFEGKREFDGNPWPMWFADSRGWKVL